MGNEGLWCVIENTLQMLQDARKLGDTSTYIRPSYALPKGQSEP